MFREMTLICYCIEKMLKCLLQGEKLHDPGNQLSVKDENAVRDICQVHASRLGNVTQNGWP